MDEFPTVTDLAAAPEDRVLKIWQGLGYYSRARNMHAAAKSIVADHGGIFPSTLESIRQLKGVGPYTAAAIASFAFGIPAAVVDGNVIRLISRLFAITTPVDDAATRKEIEQLAQALLDTERPATHNQAMMEAGALICTPANPQCGTCPVQSFCKGKALGVHANLPIKKGKTKRRSRWFHYFVVTDPNGNTLIKKRTASDIWQGLYEFPMVEPGNGKLELPAYASDWAMTYESTGKKHVLSHQDIHPVYRVFEAEVLQEVPGMQRVHISELGNFPFPRMLAGFLEKWQCGQR